MQRTLQFLRGGNIQTRWWLPFCTPYPRRNQIRFDRMSDGTSRRPFLKQVGTIAAASTVGLPSVLFPNQNETLSPAHDYSQ
jgi:hypothetical protein